MPIRGQSLRLLSDAWSNLRSRTAARIALGRAGGSLPTAEVIAFAQDHAAAKDAVHAELDVDALRNAIEPLNHPIQIVHSAAPDRATYLQRPDLGRRLAENATLQGSGEIAIILGDGLSALAVQRHGPSVLAALLPLLRHHTIAPIVIAQQARVALSDEIGQLLKAKLAIMLLGERPGLGSADSLGAYLVFDPRPGRNDSQRNCVSNIRPTGLDPVAAAEMLAYLIEQSLTQQISGIHLKDERLLL